MRINFTVSQLIYALSLEKEQNFRKAAKKCHISQPTLSMQILKLEKILGVMLFDRSKKPVLPTEIGKKILGEARVIVQGFKQLEAIIQNEKEEVSGDYRLGIISSLAPYLIPTFLVQFNQAYPEVRLSISESTTDEIVDRLNRDQLDCGIIATPYDQLYPKQSFLKKENL